MLLGAFAAPVQGSVPAETVEHLRLQVSLRRYAALADTLGPFLERARAAGDSLRLGQLTCLEGQAALGVGEVERSLRILERARDLAIAQRDTSTWMTTLGVSAFALNRQGRYDEGVRSATRQIELARASGDQLGEAFAQWSLAYAELQRNHLDAARVAYQRAQAIFGEYGQHREELTTLVGLGRVESQAGNPEEARRINGRVLRLAEDLGDTVNLADALNNLGAIEFELGRRDLAARYALRAYEAQKRRGVDRSGRSVILANVLGFHAQYLPEARIPDLLSELEALCAEAEEAGDTESLVRGLFGIAEHHLQRGRGRSAAESFDRIATLTSATRDRQRAVILSCVARRFDAPAEDLLRRLDEEFPPGLEPHPSEAARLATERVFLLNRLGRSEEALAVSEARLPHPDADMTDAHLLSGRATALARRGQIRESVAALERSVSAVETRWKRGDDASTRWTTLSAHRRHVVDAAAEVLLAAPEGSHETTGLVFQLLQRLKARNILRELGLDDETFQIEDVSLGAIRSEALGAGEVLLDYSLGYDHAIVFGLSRDRDRFHVFAGQAGRLREVSELLTEWIVPSSGIPTSDPGPVVRRAYDLILSPVAGLLAGADRVSISPDGALTAVPFGVLLDRSGETTPPRHERIPCVALRTLEPAGIPKGGHVVTIAGRGADLPGIQAEVGALRGRFARVRHLEGFAEDWADSLRGAAVVHVAAHAEVDGWQPWRSGFRLDLPAETSEPGLLRPSHLRVSDIVGTRLDAGLAVLSACESGVGLLSHGEGALGLSTAFLMARCRAVVSTLWPVDDAVTADFMERLYDDLHRGASVSAAVRSAQLGIRSRTRTAHPYYWAGFVAIGDGDLTVALEGRGVGWSPLVWGLLGGAGIVVLGAGVRRRNRKPV